MRIRLPIIQDDPKLSIPKTYNGSFKKLSIWSSTLAKYKDKQREAIWIQRRIACPCRLTNRNKVVHSQRTSMLREVVAEARKIEVSHVDKLSHTSF